VAAGRSTLKLCVVGGGWAGLAAAVEAAVAGHAVTLFEMAPQLGGRARRVPPAPQDPAGLAFDNGQHILIGAYGESLRLMRQVGVDVQAAFDRRPLTLQFADGTGLRLPAGPALTAFARGVLAARGWSLGDRLALLAAAGSWLLRGFRCAPSLSVAQLTARVPQRLREELLAPLCVAALNTPVERASAAVFLRVMHDALFAGPGAADLLLPRVDLSALWPEKARDWLHAQGTRIETGVRVAALERRPVGWAVEGEAFDRVILACSAVEAARLAQQEAPAWAEQARALRYEPIVTVLVSSAGTQLTQPMLALRQGLAQYVFDLGQLRADAAAAGVLAAVISGAREAVEQGLEVAAESVRQQLTRELGPQLRQEPKVLRTLCEKRATFLCTPDLRRPPAAIAAGLWAAGDYVEGPYPATLEGAVRSGSAAARRSTQPH
jgi:squalene-associated FAD-dependent desaturase